MTTTTQTAASQLADVAVIAARARQEAIRQPVIDILVASQGSLADLHVRLGEMLATAERYVSRLRDGAELVLARELATEISEGLEGIAEAAGELPDTLDAITALVGLTPEEEEAKREKKREARRLRRETRKARRAAEAEPAAPPAPEPPAEEKPRRVKKS